MSKRISRWGRPRYFHPTNVYRTSWGATESWYGLFTYKGQRVYTGVRVTMAEAAADIAAYRAALARRDAEQPRC